MGMFDHVRTANDARFVCSEGHAIEFMQTKDFACSLGSVTFNGGKASWAPSGLAWVSEADDEVSDFVGVCNVYGFCDACERRRKDGSASGREVWVEFEIRLNCGVVEQVTRTSAPTGDQQ